MLSLKFNNVYINKWYSIASKLESKNISNIDYIIDDYYFETNSFEECEIKMDKYVINNLITDNTKLIIGSDLSNELATISKAVSFYDISFMGVYLACSSFILNLIIGSNVLNNKRTEILVITSNHAKTAERQFRFPNEYANILEPYQTLTTTASIGALISKVKSKYKIECATMGSVIDFGISDSKNMGAVMAPACCKVIFEHLKNFKRNINDYDLILTGDLGNVGLKILKKLLYELYKIKSNNIKDAGKIIYSGINNGGSGPCCLPLVFLEKILKENKYKKILLVGTGSLHNSTLVNQRKTIPAIAEALEVTVND